MAEMFGSTTKVMASVRAQKVYNFFDTLFNFSVESSREKFRVIEVCFE